MRKLNVVARSSARPPKTIVTDGRLGPRINQSWLPTPPYFRERLTTTVSVPADIALNPLWTKADCWRAWPSILQGPVLLMRLKIRPDAWLGAMTKHGLRTRGAFGREQSLCAFAEKRGRTRVAGRGFAKALFGS